MTHHLIIRSLIPAIMLFGAAGAAAQNSEPQPAQKLMQAPYPGGQGNPVLAVQVLLDHTGHSPGAIDGMSGGNTVRAIKAFQQAAGMTVDGKLSDELVQKLRARYSGALEQEYVITSEDVAGPFVTVPGDMEGQSKLEQLSYESPAEGLAEKFHMAQSFLKKLNPGADFGKAGTRITVVMPGKAAVDAKVARIEVDKAGSAVRAFAADGTLVATYPATVGSSTFPSPDGTMEVTAVAAEPKYYFSPEGRDWGPDRKLTIAAGPNNPVGGTWIDLSKDGYGIHGTPDPRLIGKTSSHGCVRLTNWDAEELAQTVSKGTTVEFV